MNSACGGRTVDTAQPALIYAYIYTALVYVPLGQLGRYTPVLQPLGWIYVFINVCIYIRDYISLLRIHSILMDFFKASDCTEESRKDETCV